MRQAAIVLAVFAVLGLTASFALAGDCGYRPYYGHGYHGYGHQGHGFMPPGIHFRPTFHHPPLYRPHPHHPWLTRPFPGHPWVPAPGHYRSYHRYRHQPRYHGMHGHRFGISMGW